MGIFELLVIILIGIGDVMLALLLGLMYSFNTRLVKLESLNIRSKNRD